MSFLVDEYLPADVMEEIQVSDQMHVLSYFEDGEYTEEDIASLVDQIRSFDLIRARNLYTNSIAHKSILEQIYNDISRYPNDYIRLNSLSKSKTDEFETIGYKVIAEEKLVLVILAGGQASRLSPDIIKGNMDFGLPSHKSLFDRLLFHIRRVQFLVKEHTGKDINIPIYVMTSEFNRNSIENNILLIYPIYLFLTILFKANHYYGLLREQISYFSQGSLPCVDSKGSFIMREKHKIALSPDGSGGLFRALWKNRIIDIWRQKEIQYVQVFGIDNVAQIPADPLFVGYAVSRGSDMCVKCVEKSCPEEKLSVVTCYSGKPMLAIHSEMTYRQICHRDDQGELLYPYGFISDSVMTVDFLEKRCCESALPAYCHIVQKAIPYYDSILNRTIKPITPNAYKMEYYVSDVMPLAQHFDVMVVPRCEYVPIKNPPGKPIASPEKAVDLITQQHLGFLMKAHISLKPYSADQRRLVEISPLVTIRGEGLNRLIAISLQTPCCVLDCSEVDLSYPHQNLSDNVVLFDNKMNGYNVYVFL